MLRGKGVSGREAPVRPEDPHPWARWTPFSTAKTTAHVSNPKTFLKKPPAPARMATRGNPSGDSIAEPSTDLRAMIEDPDHESMDEDPATLDNGKFSCLPLAQLPHQKNRRAAAS